MKKRTKLSIILLVIIAIIGGIYDYEALNKNREIIANYKDALKSLDKSIPLQPEIVWGNRKKKEVIFTFDGGDGAQSAVQIMATLKKHHVVGSFFLTGKFILRNPELVRKMVADGDEIFDHTYDHPHLTEIPDGRIVWELQRMSEVLASTTGIQSRPYFRPPYGDRDARVLKMAAKAGYRSVYWTIDAHDWETDRGITDGEVRDQILSNVAPGTIYLMHFGDAITGNILDEVFSTIESRGYKIVSLTQGL